MHVAIFRHCARRTARASRKDRGWLRRDKGRGGEIGRRGARRAGDPAIVIGIRHVPLRAPAEGAGDAGAPRPDAATAICRDRIRSWRRGLAGLRLGAL